MTASSGDLVCPGQDHHGQGITQACFPELQTLSLILFAYIVPLWDFSPCPVLGRLELRVGLPSTDGGRVLNLTCLTDLRVRQLALEVGYDHILYTRFKFADWDLNLPAILSRTVQGVWCHAEAAMSAGSKQGA